jgi:hypothetical protein
MSGIEGMDVLNAMDLAARNEGRVAETLRAVSRKVPDDHVGGIRDMVAKVTAAMTALEIRSETIAALFKVLEKFSPESEEAAQKTLDKMATNALLGGKSACERYGHVGTMLFTSEAERQKHQRPDGSWKCTRCGEWVPGGDGDAAEK